MRACPVSGKVQHFTREAAYASADFEMQHGAPALSVYRCPWCNYWHLTKNHVPMRRVKKMLLIIEQRRAHYME